MAKKLFYSQIFVVLILVFACICTTPLLISHLSSDSDRLCNINHWSNDTSIKADYVFFGASGAMNGIAGDTISNLYNANVVSFTSTGQSLSESFLFYSRVNDETKAVIQCISAGDLSGEPGINGFKVNRLIVDGYKMDSVTRTLIDKSTPQLFEKSYIGACLDVRSFAKTYLHNSLKELMQPEQLRKGASSDIQNAYLFTYERAPEEHFKKYYALMPKEQVDSLVLNNEKVEMINRAYDYFELRGINYYLVLLPVSSYAIKGHPLDYKEAIEKSAIKCDVIDCSFILEDDCFADPAHSNRKGASILSKYIMDRIVDTDTIK